jgi:hypothetical protein
MMRSRQLIRTATFDDYDVICGVLRRNGMSSRTYEAWTHLWLENPIYPECRAFPIGHILQNEKAEAVGTSTVFPIGYSYNGERIRATAVGAWVVDPAYRSQSLLMTVEFLNVPADLVLDTTASPQASKVMQAFGLHRMPVAWFDEQLCWILNYRRFAASTLLKKGYSSMPSVVASAGGLGLGAADTIRGRRPRKITTPGFTVELANGFDARFDAFWNELRRTPGRLLRIRDAASLKWAFGTRDHWILTAQKNGRLAGWAVLLREDRPKYRLRRLQVADLQALDDDPGCVRALFGGAVQFGRQADVDVLEVTGFNRPKRAVFEDLAPYRWRLGNWPYFYKAAQTDLDAALSRPEAWDPTIRDGD